MFDALQTKRGSAADVSWAELVDNYVATFNGFNPMTTTLKLLEVAKNIPLLEAQDEHGVRFVFSTLRSSVANTYDNVRVIVQKVRTVRVRYRMDCEAILPLGNCPGGYTPDFAVPPTDYGELVDYTTMEDA